MKLSVSCGAGVETATKLELRALGIEAPCLQGRFLFEGTPEDIVRCNLYLRTADRVGIVLGTFPAHTFDDLYEGIAALPWADVLPRDAAIHLQAKSQKSKLFALSAVQSVAKKAIVTDLIQKYGSAPETGAAARIEVAIVGDEATVSLDTSGDGLHKRGYRDFVGEAPIRETLAAAILKLSVWNPDRPLIDPFCGSGTILIEAGMIAKNIAPGLYRTFAFESLGLVSAEQTAKRRQEAQERIEHDKSMRISGFDINPKAVRLAVRHATKIGLEKDIHIETKDMRDVRSRYRYGVIVTNPPYGERLLEEKELRTLYRDFGTLYRSLDGWSLYAITAYADFERCFGKRADGNRKLFNAGLSCRLYRYLGPAPQKTDAMDAKDW